MSERKIKIAHMFPEVLNLYDDSSVAMDALDDIEDSLPSVSDYGFLDDSIDDADDETTYISESILSADDTDGYPEEEIDPGLGMNGDVDELDELF